MPSYEQITKQIADVGVYVKNLPTDELKDLPEVLHETESLRGIARGLYTNQSGLLLATNERVIFYDKGRQWGSHVEEFRYDKITSIEYATGQTGGTITINTTNNPAKIEMVPNIYCKPFVEAVRALMPA